MVYGDEKILKEIMKWERESKYFERMNPLAEKDKNVLKNMSSYFAIKEKLYESVLEKISKGKLVADGYDSRNSFPTFPFQIPPNLFFILKVDWNRCRLFGPGFQIYDIKVRPPQKFLLKHIRKLDEWFVRTVDSSSRILTKDEMHQRSIQELEIDVPGTHFLNVWKRKAPKDWKAAGRRKTMN